MHDLILELYTEEIPALMQKPAEEEYKRIFEKAFAEAEISYSLLNMYIGPRRIVLHVDDLPKELPAKNIQIKGPKLSAPDGAIEGFCKSNNIAKKDLVVQNIKDQECYVYETRTKPQQIRDILPQILIRAIEEYSWPKSMYWGDYKIKWVRPLINIMCILDDKILEMSFGHLKANNISFGHRFIAYNKFEILDWNDYNNKLKNSFVILGRAERLKLIQDGIAIAEKKHNLHVEIDNKLLEEVAGLAEYISVLVGKIPEKFMHLPSEILETSMRTHQRYFTTRFSDGKFAPYFVFVSNLSGVDLSDVIEGNEKVLSARLADAAYFYRQDKKLPLEGRLDKLKTVVFHTKLGTMFDKTQRLRSLVQYLQPNNENLARAALLCKADLVTEAVGEFPELQGIMGSYYALEAGEEVQVVDAIRNHYKPQGVEDLPTGIAAYLSLADKTDSLVGLMLAGERATGSKDPYALRRYALGIIKIILANNLKSISMKTLINYSAELYSLSSYALEGNVVSQKDEILGFIEERFKHSLREESDVALINTAVDLSVEDDILITLDKLHILQQILDSDNGKILLQLYRRVRNILGEEQISVTIDVAKFKLQEERDLYAAITLILPEIDVAVKSKDFSNATRCLLSLSAVIAKFFDNVMVNDTDATIALNRKAMLTLVADIFSKIANFEHVV